MAKVGAAAGEESLYAALDWLRLLKQAWSQPGLQAELARRQDS